MIEETGEDFDDKIYKFYNVMQNECNIFIMFDFYFKN